MDRMLILEGGLMMRQRIKRMKRINREVDLMKEKMAQMKVKKMENKMKIKRKQRDLMMS